MNDCYEKDLEIINKERYIDTSSIMNYVSLQKYIDKNKSKLISNKIKIIVCKEVYDELHKHIRQGDRKKHKLASKGLEIINNNIEIFELRSCCENKNVKNSFADKSSLALMLDNRTNKSQMLITNDADLALDAYGLKKLKSVYGGAIFVKYIDKNGELKDHLVIEDSKDIYINNWHNSDIETERIINKDFIKGVGYTTLLMVVSYVNIKYDLNFTRSIQKIVKEMSCNFYKTIKN